MASALGLPQHPHQHRPERRILLAVDQELGEAAARGVVQSLADPVDSLEVREHQDVEKLGAGSGPEGVQACPETVFELERRAGPRGRTIGCPCNSLRSMRTP